MNVVSRALICRKIESLFDSMGKVSFNYDDTLRKEGSIEIAITASALFESEILHRICKWLGKRNISHYKIFDNNKSFITIQADGFDKLLNLIEPSEFDYLYDAISEKIKL